MEIKTKNNEIVNSHYENGPHMRAEFWNWNWDGSSPINHGMRAFEVWHWRVGFVRDERYGYLAPPRIHINSVTMESVEDAQIWLICAKNAVAAFIAAKAQSQPEQPDAQEVWTEVVGEEGGK